MLYVLLLLSDVRTTEEILTVPANETTMEGSGQQSDFARYMDGSDERPPGEAVAVAGNGGVRPTEVVDPESAQFQPVDEEIEIGVVQVNYTVVGNGTDETPVIHVFGRSPDESAEHVRVYGFRPYFYAPTDTLDDNRLADDRITGTEDGHRGIKGEALTKIYGRTPRDVGAIRDEFEHYEADILFPNRFLIDKRIKSGIRIPDRRADDGALQIHHDEIEPIERTVHPRIHFMDIEVDDRSGFPQDGEEPIICLSSYDSSRCEYVGWIFRSRDAASELPSELTAYEPIGEPTPIHIRAFESEEAMLDDYLGYIEETDPDCLTGWNIDDFDAPYLLDRLERLDPNTDFELSIERLSRVNEVWRSNWQGPNIKGRVLFDLLYAYRRTQFSELDSYRLDAVGEVELGIGKERYTGDIGDLWEHDPSTLLAYNIRDVELCVEIDRKQDVIAFWNEVRSFVGCKLEDATTPGDTVDVFVLHKVHGKFALPSKGQAEAEQYEGGAVFDPITGVRENVIVLDLKSLYPMAMMTINASPETKVGPEYDGPAFRAPNGIRFRKEPAGIIREMVTELLEERDLKKGLRDEHAPNSDRYRKFNRQQASVKVIMNSLYGVLGWERFRLYDREMGAAVTATGREVLQYTESVARDLGKPVVYGDTDSVMLELGGDISTTATIEQSFELEEVINERYAQFAADELNATEHHFQIEFEKLYRRFFQAGKKKRYAGHVIWKEGNEVDDIDITGFEYKRSDIAPITKEVQRSVIEKIVTGEDVDSIKSYVNSVILDFQSGNVNLDDVAIPGGIGKRLENYDTDTAHVRGAKYANLLLGTNFNRGSKPKRLYLRKVHPSYFRRVEAGRGLDPAHDPIYSEFKRNPDVICYEYPDQVPPEFEIDWEKMLEKTLRGPISRVLEAIDISWDEVKTGQEQTGLGSFM